MTIIGHDFDERSPPPLARKWRSCFPLSIFKRK
jgi:hypothetical protein